MMLKALRKSWFDIFLKENVCKFMRLLVYLENSYKVFHLIAGKLMRNIRIKFLFVKCVTKWTGKVYFELFPNTNVWKIFWGTWQTQNRASSSLKKKNSIKSQQRQLSSYGHSTNRKQSSGTLYSWNKMQVRGGTRTPTTHLLGTVNLLQYLYIRK